MQRTCPYEHPIFAPLAETKWAQFCCPLFFILIEVIEVSNSFFFFPTPTHLNSHNQMQQISKFPMYLQHTQQWQEGRGDVEIPS
jgi:hypothetical protein